jgi:hypothetical protein
VQLTRREATGALSQAERDSLLREVEARRSAWRALGINAYRIEVAVGCFCPWRDTPGVLEVRDGKPVALRDTAGKSMGAPREPWSRYTVEQLFDHVARAAVSSDVVEVAFDPTYGYPAYVRGDGKIGLPDDWFWFRAGRLTPLR